MKYRGEQMNLGEKAYSELFNKEPDRKINVNYSGKFKDYNANVRYSAFKLEFSLSKSWKTVSEEIQIGLLQGLLLKVYKKKASTMNMDLYESFMKNLNRFSTPSNFDPELEQAFNRMNAQYFNDFLEKPNLVWGKESFAKLGSYEYASDKITISTVLRGEFELLDFVMYHEMLHKKLQFETKNGRNFHHTPEFKRLEKQFYIPDIEKRLTQFLRKKRLRKAFRWF